MTTEIANFSTPIREVLHLISSTEDPAMWSHPVLDLFAKEKKFGEVQEDVVHRTKLYLVPTTFGEEYEDGDEPVPTSAQDLPDIHIWTMRFAVSVIEIWAGRRQPAQLISHCHRFIYMDLLKAVGSQKEIGRIRTIHQNEPLDGICESTVTVRYGNRLRAMVIRFEGVNEKWLCTELKIL
jgi:hypothetical protein